MEISLKSLVSENPWADGYGAGEALQCPVCQNQYVHFHAPQMVRGEYAWGKEDGRHVGGPVLLIEMWSECGSQWEVSLGFHKGFTFVFVDVFCSCAKPDSFVYFVEAVGLGRIKIGKANDVKKRLATLQVGSPVPLRLLGSIGGGFPMEQKIHESFELLRIQGEWFKDTPELRSYIAHVTSGEL